MSRRFPRDGLVWRAFKFLSSVVLSQAIFQMPPAILHTELVNILAILVHEILATR